LAAARTAATLTLGDISGEILAGAVLDHGQAHPEFVAFLVAHVVHHSADDVDAESPRAYFVKIPGLDDRRVDLTSLVLDDNPERLARTGVAERARPSGLCAGEQADPDGLVGGALVPVTDHVGEGFIDSRRATPATSSRVPLR
jgi:hypothetical protein